MTKASATIRINALLIDGITLFVFIYILLPIALPLLFQSNEIRGRVGAGLLLLIFLYEPFMVRYFGATIGHKFFGLYVKSVNGSNLTMLQAMMRSLIKGFFGLFSFMTFYRSGNTIHDYFTNSCVYLKKSN